MDRINGKSDAIYSVVCSGSSNIIYAIRNIVIDCPSTNHNTNIMVDGWL